MIYQSKKDETVKAELVKREEKYNTVILKYLSGDNEGKSISVTTSTLKRWWKAVDEEKSTESILNINPDIVNTPYPEPKEKKYIPKPQSVIDYENKKRNRYNSELPNFDSVVDDFGSISSSVNNNSEYIKFPNKSTLWRKKSYIDMYVVEEFFIKLSEAGLLSTPNKDKDRPFAFRITTSEEYEKVKGALL